MVARLATLALILSTIGTAAMADERAERRERDWDKNPRSLRYDDHHKQSKSTTSVLEPGNLLLLGTGLLAGWAALKRRTRMS